VIGFHRTRSRAGGRPSRRPPAGVHRRATACFSPRQYREAAWLLILAAAAVHLSACQQSAPHVTPNASRSAIASPAASPSPTGPGYPDRSDFRIGRPLHLPFRALRLSGDWELAGFTDSTCTLMRLEPSHYPYQTLYLMDLAQLQPQLVRAWPVNRQAGFIMLSAETSDTWLVWEEVANGDDLRRPTSWKLYAGGIQRPELRLDQPILVDSGRTPTHSRPLFDICGDRLLWAITSPGKPATTVLTAVDLRRRSTLFSLHLNGVASSLTTAGDEAWVTMLEHAGNPAARLRCFNSTSGKELPDLCLNNPSQLSHWTARGLGWTAWALFPSPEEPHPTLYARDPRGTLHKVLDNANDPCFAGNHLVFDQCTMPSARATDGEAVIWVADLRAGVLRELLRGDTATGGWWYVPVNGGSTQRTLVVATVALPDVGVPLETQLRVYRFK